MADLRLELVLLDELHLDPANPRRIGATQLEALTRSVRQFGMVAPIVARRTDHVIIAGHQRALVARRLGMTTVPAIFLDVTVDEARLLGLALNRIQGEWDPDLLGRILTDLRLTPTVDLTIAGFGGDEIAGYLRTLTLRERRERNEPTDLAEVLEAARGTPRTRPGNRIILGDHVVLCGDSTRAEDIERALCGARPAMAFTDPPYNVGYAGGHGRKRRAIANDALRVDQWDRFVTAWATQLVTHVDGAIYVCMSSAELPAVTRALAAAGGHWSDTIIWAKDRFTLGRADFQRQYEPVWYGWHEGGPHQWYGGRAQGDVWNIDRPGDSPLHPTMKPLALIERALENSSSIGDLVLDLFLGSGSTLIACERTARRCIGVELDPVNCDVIVARWEAFTGQRATYESDGALRRPHS